MGHMPHTILPMNLILIITIVLAVFQFQQVLGVFTNTVPLFPSSTKIQPTNSAVRGLEMEKIASKSNVRHYIFGYGSLVCSKSRKITAPTLTKPAQPVVIDHIRRTWTARVPHRGDVIREDLDHIIHGQTAMGVEMSEGHNCTGVLIEVEADELANFDEREKGYDRVEIDLHHIFSLEDHGKESCLEDENTIDHHVLRKAHHKRNSIEPSEGQTPEESDGTIDDAHIYDEVKVWVYVPKNGGDGADHNFPIMQSYVGK